MKRLGVNQPFAGPNLTQPAPRKARRRAADIMVRANRAACCPSERASPAYDAALSALNPARKDDLAPHR